MTKEKIKNTPKIVDYLLDKSITADSRKKLHKRMDEICNLAIKALEQEPTAIPQQPTLSVEDLISWAKERRINIQVVKSDNPDTFEKIFGELCEDEYSQYEPKPKTGHWIGHREHCENLGVMPSGLGAYEWCSNCDCGIDVREWHRNHYNYCPNCGAKMVESEVEK